MATEQLMTPEMFQEAAEKLIDRHSKDLEISHIELDKLMEDMLIGLGYEQGAYLIRASGRYYS